MSYQVLARKYRPSHFKAMEGQGHVLQALINALDQDRLHHAYLFTGTRGVGKTTIARIFAKCLNCEQGITSEPCGTCASCLEISEGRSVDLIEVDAASRTGVDDMRDLLDNVQYLPTASRFKVYLIDEVHMLSKSSFNAMLKTLEEPPEHVKFLFATTDPKKLPVTVLSRCLQFNLKNMTPERVVNYLQWVMGEEGIEAEEEALWQLGRAADGSMRDALSLTDQAIAFGSGQLLATEVAAMLGTVDRQEIFRILEAVAEQNAQKVYEIVDQLAAFGPDYEALIDELLMVLHKMAVYQVVPEGVDNSMGDREKTAALASVLSQEQVQLCYQIALVGKRDLPYVPDPKIGFEMTLIRMLAFELDDDPSPGQKQRQPSPAKSSPASGASPLSAIKAQVAGSPESRQQEKTTAETVSVERQPRPMPAPSAPPSERLKSINEAAAPAAVESAAVPNTSSAEARALPERDAESSSPPHSSTASGPASTVDADAVPLINAQKSDNVIALSASARGAETISEVHQNNSAKVRPPSESPMIARGPQGQTKTEIKTDTEATETITETDIATAREQAEVRDQDQQWCDLLVSTGLGGVAYAMASNCILVSIADGRFELALDPAHSSLFNTIQSERLADAISEQLGQAAQVHIQVAAAAGQTPAKLLEDQRHRALKQAEQTLVSDPGVQQLMSGFGATIVKGSVTPMSGRGES